MATPTPISVEVIRGDDERLDLAFKLAPNGTVVNLTGHQGIWFTAKRFSSDPDSDAVFQKSTGAGTIIVDDAVNGLAHVVINAADTDGVEPTSLYYDCQFKDSLGKIRTAALGQLKVVADVTRTTT